MMIADKIKQLRTSRDMTQSDLAKKLNITRSSVNAWEMGLSTPSTAYLVELSQLFHVSTAVSYTHLECSRSLTC